jgi:gallate dioxygenase
LSKYVFDLEKSAKGLRLNRFLNGLVHEKNRNHFLENPEAAMKDLAENEKDMVRRLDWKALQDYGASFFCLEKLARAKGVSNPQMVAAFRGESLEAFLKTRRVPGAR